MTGTDFHIGEETARGLAHGEGERGQSARDMPNRYQPPTPEEIAAMRRNFLEWVAWYEEHNQDGVKNQGQLAARIGVAESTVSMWRKEGATRMPDFRSLIGVAKMVSAPIDHILRNPPRW